MKVEYRVFQKMNTKRTRKGIQCDPKMEYSVIPKENTG